MSYKADSVYLRQVSREAILRMLQHPLIKHVGRAVLQQRNDSDFLVNITRKAHLRNPVEPPYIAYNLRSPHTGLVELPPRMIECKHFPDGRTRDVILCAHEFTHQVGGVELDAEVVEALLCAELHSIPVITNGDLDEFDENQHGTFYDLMISEDSDMVIYYLPTTLFLMPLWVRTGGMRIPNAYVLKDLWVFPGVLVEPD